MSFCQYNRKLSSILSFFGSSQWVARGGAKRPCKRERAFFLHKSSSQIGQWTDKRNNERDELGAYGCPARPARPACFARPAHDTPYAHCPRSPVHRVHHAPSGLLCVLYALSNSQAGKRGKTAWGSKMSAFWGCKSALNNGNYV